MKKWRKIKKISELSGQIFSYEKSVFESEETGQSGQLDLLHFNDWVNIIALDENDRFIMVKQFRAGSNDITIEIPGGAVDKGEDDLLAAMRELKEETGHESCDWSQIGDVSPNPAFMSNRCKTFLAKNCVASSKQSLDLLEEIEVVFLKEREVLQMISNGVIDHSLVIAAVHFYLSEKS